MRCIALDRSRRWSSARALKQALKAGSRATVDGLPEPLHDLPSFGPYAALWALGWSAIALMVPRSAGDLALLLLIALLVPLGLALHVWFVGRQGLRLAEIARIAWWPPEWWGMWWPRSLRRSGDLWARLPRPARVTRITLSAFFLAIPTLILARQWLLARGLVSGAYPIQSRFVIAQLVLLGLAAAVLCGAFLWARARGLTIPESARMLLGATMPSSAWRAPAMARLLAPARASAGEPVGESPEAYERAIVELSRRLPQPAGDRVRDVGIAAGRLLREIEQADVEIAALTHESADSEMARLGGRLASLTTGAAGGPERARLRQLLQEELDLLHRMRARREELRAGRARKFEELRELWTHLCRLHDADREVPPAALARVRELCESAPRPGAH